MSCHRTHRPIGRMYEHNRATPTGKTASPHEASSVRIVSDHGQPKKSANGQPGLERSLDSLRNQGITRLRGF